MLTSGDWPWNDGAAVANTANPLRGRRCGQTEQNGKSTNSENVLQRGQFACMLAKLTYTVAAAAVVSTMNFPLLLSSL